MIWERIKELEEKQQQLEFQIQKIEEMLKVLPNGHLEIKDINGRKYYYLRYWEDGRLKSKYIGKNASEIESKLKQASELKNRLSLLKQEKEKIDRILNRIYKIIDENING